MMMHPQQASPWLTALSAITVLALCTQLSTAASLPDGLDTKPLIDQLLARKAFLKEHLNSQEWRSRMERMHRDFSKPENQRGVLIVAGGRDMFANAAITLRVLRRALRSKVPVEIVHYGAKELPPPEVLALITGGATHNDSSSSSTGADGDLGPVFVTDALSVAPPEDSAGHHRKLPEGIKGFAAKVYALTHVTRFKQVLLLDADSMPLVDPLLLFQVPLFQRTGSLFWPDLWHNAWVNATIYSLVGGMSSAPWEGNKQHRLVDSGQMLFNRQQHAEVLEYLWLLNSHHEWVYKHMHGDKDTFLLAFAMAEKLDSFKQVPCFARDAMREVGTHQHKFHHLGMVQSIPPAVLAAAVRADMRAKAAGGGSSSSGSSMGASGSGGQAGLHRRALLLQAAAAAAIHPSSSSGDSSSDSSSHGSSDDSSDDSSSEAWAKVWDGDSSNDDDFDDYTEDESLFVSGSELVDMYMGQASKQTGASSATVRSFNQLLQQLLLPGTKGRSSGSNGSSRRLQQPASEGDDAAADDDDEFDDLGRSAPISGTAAGTAGAAAGAAAAAAGGGGSVAQLRPNSRHIGIPVFFHRTSFNSKFFPDCLNADKITTHYCEVQWVSVPLSDQQAGNSLKPNMFAFNADQVDTNFYQQHCVPNTTTSSSGSSSGSGSSSSTKPMSSWVASGLGIENRNNNAAQQQGVRRKLAAEGPTTQGGPEDVGSSTSSGSSSWQRRLLWWQHLLVPDSAASSSSYTGSSGSSSSSRRRLQQQQGPRLPGRRPRRRRVLSQFGLPPEHTCDRLPVGEDVLPIPVMKVVLFHHMEGVLQGSYEAFKEVREALKLPS